MPDPQADLYELLGLSDRTATDAQLRTAYRQRSLKVHPDRNPSPEAATLFNALFEAYELLKDPAKRAKYDQEASAKEARAARFAGLDSKRKAQVADLNEREDAFKRSKEDEFTKQRQRDLEIQRLRDEGARLRREKDQQEQARRQSALAQSAATASPVVHTAGVHGLDPLDTTLRLKWPRASLPDCDSEAGLRALLLPHLPSTDSIDSLVISSKLKASPSKSKNKSGSAVVSLKTLNATIKLVQAAERKKLPEGFEVTWAAGEVPKLARAAMGLMEVEQEGDSTTQPASQQVRRSFKRHVPF
jgi:DnaJ family protein C protein 17